jgi:phage terminase large subunit-like protein
VKVHGTFPQLEDECCTYSGTGDSLNLLDGMVWALSDLMVVARMPQFLWA